MRPPSMCPAQRCTRGLNKVPYDVPREHTSKGLAQVIFRLSKYTTENCQASSVISRKAPFLHQKAAARELPLIHSKRRRVYGFHPARPSPRCSNPCREKTRSSTASKQARYSASRRSDAAVLSAQCRFGQLWRNIEGG